MVHKSKVIRGLANFVDAEIVSKMRGGWQGWIVGGVSALALSKADDILKALSENSLVKALRVIDGEQIDIDSLYREIRVQAEKSNATIDLPLVGSITLGVNDVDRLYRLIMEA